MIGLKSKSEANQAFWPRAILLSGMVIVLVSGAFFTGAAFSDGGSVIKSLAQDNRLFFGTPSDSAKTTKAKGFDEKLFWEVWNTLKDNYVDRDKLTDKSLLYGALEGLAMSTGDPYTVFMTPTSTQAFQQDMSGSFEGIGAEIGLEKEIITVVAPIEGMPAEKAGVRAGDKIIKIDNQLTAGFTVSEAVAKIRGPKGTKVKLTISREGRKDLFDISIGRAVIQVQSVKTKLNNGIFIIRVSSFNDDTDTLFAQAVSEAIAKNPKGIILDLRNNPGGYLIGAVKMASAWVSDGTIVSEKYADGRIQSHHSVGQARLAGFKTVVLINKGSASASEIVAGALQDTKTATIVGEKSFGKGSVQEVKQFSDGSSLKVTAAKWLTPAGRSIDKDGIMPDVKIELTAADADKKLDPQLNKAMSLLKGGK